MPKGILPPHGSPRKNDKSKSSTVAPRRFDLGDISMSDRSSIPPDASSSDVTMREVSIMREEPVHHNTSMDTNWDMPDPSPRPEWTEPHNTRDTSEEETTIIKREEDSFLEESSKGRNLASLTQALPTRSATLTRRLPVQSHTTGTAGLVSEFAALSVKKPPAPTVASSTKGVPSSVPNTGPTTGKHSSACKVETLPAPKMEPATKTPFYLLTRGWLVPGQAMPEYDHQQILTREQYLSLARSELAKEGVSADDSGQSTPDEDVTILAVADNGVGTHTSAAHSESNPATEETENEEEGGENSANETESDQEEASSEDEDTDEEEGIFTPQLIKEVHEKSCGNTYKAGVKTLGLPITTHRLWEKSTYQYDHKWLEKNNIPKSILDDFSSRMKMEELIPKGALKLNDELYIKAETAEGAAVEKYGIMVGLTKHENIAAKSGKKNTKTYPEMHLYVNGDRKGEMEFCKGPKELVKELSALSPATKSKEEVWKAVNVRRAGEELGSLYYVRQNYHRFQIERDAWATVMGVRYRPSHTGAKKAKKAKKAEE